jgi:hypothetical protein
MAFMLLFAAARTTVLDGAIHVKDLLAKLRSYQLERKQPEHKPLNEREKQPD